MLTLYLLIILVIEIVLILLFDYCFVLKNLLIVNMQIMECYINSVFEPKTGFVGLDYKIEIQWNNNTQHWNKVIKQWSPYGKTKVLYYATNYKSFSLQ